MLLRLIRAGLIMVRHDVIKTGDRMIEVGHVKITDAGRRALKGESARRPSPRLPEADEWLLALGTRRCGRRWIPAWGCPADEPHASPGSSPSRSGRKGRGFGA